MGSDDRRIDTGAIRDLAQIIAETGLTEIEVELKDMRVRVARQPAPVTMVAAASSAAAPAVPPAAAVAPVVEAVPAADHPGAIKSPMVGVVYLSPEPGASAFVTVGTKVSQGQTLCLIEAMKTFNQIRAPRAGTVTRIGVENGAPVEYGEVLMVLD
jgi:acetyl-CoA carboxylase biotin carboxyl carrier protein